MDRSQARSTNRVRWRKNIEPYVPQGAERIDNDDNKLTIGDLIIFATACTKHMFTRNYLIKNEKETQEQTNGKCLCSY
jgi:hypothetical protein